MNSVSSVQEVASRSIALRRSIVAMVAILLGVLLQCGIAWELRANINAGYPDFRNFYTAGKIVAAGQGDLLYDRALQAKVQKTFVAPSIRGDFNFLPYIHPPFEAIAYGLLARMPYATAFWTLWVCNLLLAYACVLILRPQIPYLHEAFGLVLLGTSLFKPLMTAAIQGQDSILMLFLVIACYLGLVHRRPGLAGIALGFACFKPQQCLLFLLLVLVISERRWRVLAGFAGSAASLVVAAAVGVSWKATVGYPAAVRVFTSLYDEVKDGARSMPNVRGLTLSLLQGRVPHQTITAVIAVISTAILLATIWILYRSSHAELPLRFAALVTCVLVVSFYGYSHDFTPLLLPILLVWNFLAREGLGTPQRKLIGASLFVLICGGLASILLPQVLGCLCLLLLGLIGWELYQAPSQQMRSPVPAL